MTRRMRVLAAAALATTLMISSGCGSDEDSGPGKNGKAPDKVTYLTGFGTGGHDAFAWVAKEKGFFTEAGLDVAVSLGAPATNNQGLLSGKAQFTYSDVTQLMIQTGNNQVTEMRVIAAVHQSTLVAIFAPRVPASPGPRTSRVSGSASRRVRSPRRCCRRTASSPASTPAGSSSWRASRRAW